MMDVKTTIQHVIIVFSILMNSFVIMVLLHSRKILTVTNLLILSLTISDLIQSMCGYPYMLISYYQKDQPNDIKECQASAVIVTFTAITSTGHLIALSIEQLLSMTKPMISERWMRKRIYSLYFIVPCWLYGLMWSILPLMGWSNYAKEEHWCSLNLHDRSINVQSYNFCLILFCYLLPIFIIIYSHYRIRRELIKIQVNAAKQNGKNSRMASSIEETVRTKNILVIVMVIVFLVAWSPYAVAVFYTTLWTPASKEFLEASALLGKTSTCYNPIIYALVYKDFRNKAKRLLRISPNTVIPLTDN